MALEYGPHILNVHEMKVGNDTPATTIMSQALIGIDRKTGRQSFKGKDLLIETVSVIKDGLGIKIKLRKGQRFHTGDPVTAHDVQITFEQSVYPENNNTMAAPLEEIEVLDDRKLIFCFLEPYAVWKELLWIGITSKKYYEKVGIKIFRSQPVGSGPFQFVISDRS